MSVQYIEYLLFFLFPLLLCFYSLCFFLSQPLLFLNLSPPFLLRLPGLLFCALSFLYYGFERRRYALIAFLLCRGRFFLFLRCLLLLLLLIRFCPSRTFLTLFFFFTIVWSISVDVRCCWNWGRGGPTGQLYFCCCGFLRSCLCFLSCLSSIITRIRRCLRNIPIFTFSRSFFSFSFSFFESTFPSVSPSSSSAFSPTTD